MCSPNDMGMSLITGGEEKLPRLQSPSSRTDYCLRTEGNNSLLSCHTRSWGQPESLKDNLLDSSPLGSWEKKGERATDGNIKLHLITHFQQWSDLGAPGYIPWLLLGELISTSRKQEDTTASYLSNYVNTHCIVSSRNIFKGFLVSQLFLFVISLLLFDTTHMKSRSPNGLTCRRAGLWHRRAA